MALPGLAMLFSSSLAIDPGLFPRFFFLSISFLPYILSKRGQITYSFQGSDVAIVLFLALSALSALYATNTSEALTWLIRPCFWMGCFFIFRQLKDDERRVFVLSLLFSGTISLVSTLYQLVQSGIGRNVSYQITALHGHKNLVVSALILLACCILLALEKKIIHKNYKWLAFVALIISCLLYSKTGWIATGVLVMGWLASHYLFRKTRPVIKFNVFLWSLLCTSILVGLFYFALPIALNNQWVTLVDSERQQLWIKSFELVAEHPWLGIGAGNWQVMFPSHSLTGMFRVEDLYVTFQRPHNDFILILCEAGVFGLFLFLFTPVFTLFQSFKNSITQIALVGLTAFVVVFILLFNDFPLERAEHGMLVLFIVSLIVTPNQRTPKKWPTFFLLALLLYVCTVSAIRIRGEYYTDKMNRSFTENNFAKVIEYGQKALHPVYTLDPWSNPIQWQIGRAWQSLNVPDSAFKQFRLALNEAPYHHHLINDLGVLYYEKKQIAQARQLFLEALRISPRFDEPALNLARIEIMQGNTTRAKQVLDTMKHDSKARTYLLESLKIQLK